jgi:glycosyltransferase involved in cell wall biosynthesis
MHVVQISFFVDSRRRSPDELLADWHSLVDVAQAAAAAGTRVTVLQASMVEGLLSRDGIDYHFIAPDAAGECLTQGAKLGPVLRGLAADVLHVHGLGFPREVMGLRALAPRTPILLQDHADRLPRFWRRRTWKQAAACVDAVAFCARAQARPFERAGLLSANTAILEVPESTTDFTPGEQGAARALTQLRGDPAVLWVGHLDRNKDPLTVLEGLSMAARLLPRMELWCCYASAPLLAEVQARVAGDALLRDRVHLLGRVPHAQVQSLMRAADLLVLGSHREGSGYSVIEALACGLPTVVTDIPSFNSLVGTRAEGAGILWPVGDAQALSSAVTEVAAWPATQRRTAARARFDAELSHHALGRKLADGYAQLQLTRSARLRA